MALSLPEAAVEGVPVSYDTDQHVALLRSQIRSLRDVYQHGRDPLAVAGLDLLKVLPDQTADDQDVLGLHRRIKAEFGYHLARAQAIVAFLGIDHFRVSVIGREGA